MTTPLEHYNKRTEISGLALQKDGLEPRNVNMPQVAQNVAPQLRAGAPTSLVDVKESIANTYREQFGNRVFIDLRRCLEEFAQADGTITIKDMERIFASNHLPKFTVGIYCKQLATMAKDRAQIIKVMESLRPSIPNKRMLAISRTWDRIASGDGLLVVEWTASLDPAIRGEVTNDLGLPEGLPPTAKVLLQKASFYDYAQDLSAGFDYDTDFDAYMNLLCGGN